MAPESEFPAAPSSGHIPVLAGAALEGLCVQADGVYMDCTAGAGGHSALIAEVLAKGHGRLIALDRDPAAIERTRARLAPFLRATVLHRNFGELSKVLDELEVVHIDGVLFDVGLSSLQLDDPLRGFSFEKDGPLDMRMDPTCGATAREFLAEVSEGNLVQVLRAYGDVRPAKRIAAAIVRRRDAGRLEGTQDLAESVAEALDLVHGVPEETRTVFQAIRIAVNDELRWLKAGLHQAIAALAPGGRLVCIAFHSGEDRIVKNVLRNASRPHQERNPDGRVLRTSPRQVRLVTRKPVRPTADEIRANPRAQSGRLRIAERLATGESL